MHFNIGLLGSFVLIWVKDFSLLEKIISDEDNVYLGKDVTFDEVKTTTSDLAPDKFPRPDGYPPYFFFKSIGLW